MINLTHTVKENKDSIQLNFKVKELEKLPLNVSMKTLEIIEQNNRLSDRFVIFNNETQQFIDENKEKYKSITEKESADFKKLSTIYFNSLSGPLYIYPDRVLEIVSRVYEVESFLPDDSKLKIPKILYTTRFEENDSSNGADKFLAVKNLKQLIDTFGKPATLHSLVLFKDHLNYEYQNLHKNKKTPYGISNDIKVSTFNSKKNSHEFLESFQGKDYFFEQFFNNETKKINTPEEIFELVLLRENISLEITKTKPLKLK